MATLYPPYIEGRLPAQVGQTISLPYQLNRAQGVADLSGYQGNEKPALIRLRLSAVSTNELISDEMTCLFIDSGKDIFYANFIVNKKININTLNYEDVKMPISLQVGQHYKVQLAFEKEDVKGVYYSTVGVFKYTAQPNVYIENLELTSINRFNDVFRGMYTQLEDVTERVEYYKFIVYKNGEIIDNTGWQVHNSRNDTESNTSIDIYEFHNTIEDKDQYYHIQYSVKTVNGLEISSPIYFLYKNLDLELNLPYSEAELYNDYDEGVVSLKVTFKAGSYFTGKFIIWRQDGFTWLKLKEILVDNYYQDKTELVLFEDFTVEQGKTYTYALQQYDDSKEELIATERKVIGSITADFEDSFLYDGERQLKIRFNPKISSIKSNIQETKSNTIGGAYPFFFRNGVVRYKEFPISGLISYWMDDNNKFLIENNSIGENLREKTPSEGSSNSGYGTTNLSSDNIMREREFKFKVMDWLNNGKPKLFRSPTEGNYLVRLMNTSLSPNDTLGRMLHTFSSTAYEIDEINYSTLSKYKLVNLKEEIINGILYASRNIEANIKMVLPNATIAKISAPMNTELLLWFKNSSEPTRIIVGVSEFYNVFIAKGNELISVSSSNAATIDYAYEKRNVYPILKDGKEVVKFNSQQHCRRFLGNSEEDANKDIILDRLAAVPPHKITYLRIEKINYLSPTDNEDNTFIAVVDNEEVVVDLTASGRIEYTKNDFEEDKVPFSSLRIGSNLLVDIYYYSLEIITKE